MISNHRPIKLKIKEESPPTNNLFNFEKCGYHIQILMKSLSNGG